jgi:hypothetical protein
MNREVHVRFWERLEVKALRATRQTPHFGALPSTYVPLPGTAIEPIPGIVRCLVHGGARDDRDVGKTTGCGRSGKLQAVA